MDSPNLFEPLDLRALQEDIPTVEMFDMVNQMNRKMLYNYCKDHKIKLSRDGDTNQFVKRQNIMENYLNRTLTLIEILSFVDWGTPKREIYETVAERQWIYN
tara:strand:- start:471 stop:776 length:306 start_codon:yes stop_codon:yes gene_type:complete